MNPIIYGQIIWVFLFQSQFFALSVIAMVGILVPLIVLYLRLEINLTTLPSPQRWLVNFPISIYLAWISVATIVNMASALEASDGRGWGINSQVWTAIMMVVGTIIAVIVTWQRKDRIFTRRICLGFNSGRLKTVGKPLSRYHSCNTGRNLADTYFYSKEKISTLI